MTASVSVGGLPELPMGIRMAGEVLSNCAFNLAQRNPGQFTTRDIEALDKARKGWDAAVSAYGEQCRLAALSERTSEGWVSVDERLPKCNPRKGSLGTQVLVWPRHPNSDLGAMFYGKRQTDEPNFYIYGEVVYGVTHWQPMPEPPSATDARSKP